MTSCTLAEPPCRFPAFFFLFFLVHSVFGCIIHTTIPASLVLYDRPVQVTFLLLVQTCTFPALTFMHTYHANPLLHAFLIAVSASSPRLVLHMMIFLVFSILRSSCFCFANQVLHSVLLLVTAMTTRLWTGGVQ